MSDGFFTLGGNNLSMINQTLSVNETDLSPVTRLGSGALVKDFVAVKRSWTFSYTFLPAATLNVDDAGLGRDAIRALWAAGGSLTLGVPVEGGVDDSVTVMFSSYSETRGKQVPYWMWDVQFTLEEV